MWREKMRKKLISTIIVLFLWFSLLNANNIHLKLGFGHNGYNLENITNYKTKKSKYNFVGGITTEFTLSRAFAIETGALYKQYRGEVEVKYLFEKTKEIGTYLAKFETKYISIPILFKIYFLNEEISPYLSLGIDTNFYLSSKYSFTDEQKTGLGPYSGKYKNINLFLDITFGVLTFPDTLGIEVEFHITKSFKYLFDTTDANSHNIKLNGIEVIFGKRF
jgi:hypothetical protein